MTLQFPEAIQSCPLEQQSSASVDRVLSFRQQQK